MIDFNEIYGKTAEAATEATKRTRRGRGAKKPATAPAITDAEVIETTEAPEKEA